MGLFRNSKLGYCDSARNVLETCKYRSSFVEDKVEYSRKVGSLIRDQLVSPKTNRAITGLGYDAENYPDKESQDKEKENE